MTLPPVFDSYGEPMKFMARMKDRAAKNFRWTFMRPLENAMYLAYWSYVFDRNDDALKVCEFLSQFQFSGNYNLWTWIEHSLALEAHLLRNSNKHQKAAECVVRIRAAGFVETRLDGSLLIGKDRNINDAVADGNKTWERDWRVLMMIELCVLYDYDVAPQAITPLLTAAGLDFERRVEQVAAKVFASLHCTDPDEANTNGGNMEDLAQPARGLTDNALVAERARALGKGDILLLFQPRLAANLGIWSVVGDADVLRLHRDEAGQLHVFIVTSRARRRSRPNTGFKWLSTPR